MVPYHAVIARRSTPSVIARSAKKRKEKKIKEGKGERKQKKKERKGKDEAAAFFCRRKITTGTSEKIQKQS